MSHVDHPIPKPPAAASGHVLFEFGDAGGFRQTERGVWNGKDGAEARALIQACSHRYQIEPGYLCGVMFTRDAGYHGAGGWDLSDGDRFLHLTLGFLREETMDSLPFDEVEAMKIAESFYGDDIRRAWSEPGGKLGHYRLFCEEDWTPIQTGHLYATGWAPKAWKPVFDVPDVAMDGR